MTLIFSQGKKIKITNQFQVTSKATMNFILFKLASISKGSNTYNM